MGFCDLGREEEIQNQLPTVYTQWLALLVAWEVRAVSCGLSLGTPGGQTDQACQGLIVDKQRTQVLNPSSMILDPTLRAVQQCILLGQTYENEFFKK